MHNTVRTPLSDPSPTGDAISAVSDVATALTDLIKGYEEMADRADEDLKPIVQRLLAMHQSHAAEVLETLSRMGGQTETSGSVMGLVHTAVATARDWLDTLDTSAIGAIAEGESRIIETYDDAIERAAGHDDVTAMLMRQRDDLKAHVDAIQS